MDINALSIAMSSQSITSDVSLAVLNKSLETFEQLGEGVQKILESSVTPYLGQNIDYSV